MLITTDAIVISLSRHSDKAMRLSAYTRHTGRVELMVFGMSSKKKGLSMLTPLQRVELVWDEHPGRTIQNMKEARVRVVPQHLQNDIRKQTIALFMAEVLQKTQRLPMKDEALFDTLEKQIEQLDQSELPEEVIASFTSELNRIMGYDIFAEVRPQLKSMAVIDTLFK